MQILMLGTMISSKTKALFFQKGVSPAPADIAQEYLINGLCEDERVEEIYAICSPRIAYFPRVDIKQVHNEHWSVNKCQVQTVGFCNRPLVSILHRERNLVSAAKEWAKTHKKEKTLVIIYSMHTPFLAAAKEIKKIIPNTTVTMIVADLPQYMSQGNSIRRALKKLDAARMKRILPVVDKYILYTKYMAQALGLSEKQWMVMEGLFDAGKIPEGQGEKSVERVCIYAGNLNSQYAIDQLMEAFEKSNVQAKLQVYGDLAGGNRLTQKYGSYQKAKYCGMLPSDKMFETMQKATLLINPRPSTLALAKYSCPSKTFEYMASGTPVLMTKLPGLPEEYYPFLYFFDTEDTEGFVRSLERVLSLTDAELQKKGRDASDFIRNHKNCKLQTGRILDFSDMV